MVAMNEILLDAKKNKYAVGAFNITSMVYADAILDAAEKCKSPVVISISEHHMRKGFIPMKPACEYIQKKAKQLTVPVALHLDHGETIDCVEKAIESGFTSVMLDRSQASYEQNILDSKTVVDICAKKGVTVEAELGMIGGKEGEGHINIADESLFTNPDVALDFVQKTNVDALAIAIGNVHGRYAGKPNLDFDRLKKIASATDIPLVLHGGSGISDEDFQRLIQGGICKINFYSGNAQSTYKSLTSFFDTNPFEKGTDIGYMFSAIYKAVFETTSNQMNIFGSAQKA